MNRFRLLLSLAVAVAATVFALRHRTLCQAETERAQLRSQAEETAKLRAAAAQAKADADSSAEAGLSSAERTELLRLRGEIGPLRKELAEETNRLAKANVRARASEVAGGSLEPIVTRQEGMVRMNHAKLWIVALILHAQANGGRLPATLAEAAQLAGGAEGGDTFELVQSGEIPSFKSPATTIVLREKQPWKSASDRWNRGYAFADGHVEIAQSPTEDFADWEQRKAAQAEATAPPK